MNDIPDWAEFTFKVGGSEYYGDRDGSSSKTYPHVKYRWDREAYELWKKAKDSKPIIRQLEND